MKSIPSGIPTEIIKEILKQQQEVKDRQARFVWNMIYLFVGYVFFQYAVPWLVTQYRLFKEKQKRLDELIERNQKLREVLEKAEDVLKPRGEEKDEGVAAVGGASVQSSRLSKPKPKPGLSNSLPTPPPPPPPPLLQRVAAAESEQQDPTVGLRRRVVGGTTQASPLPPSTSTSAITKNSSSSLDSRRIRDEQDRDFASAEQAAEASELQRNIDALEAAELYEAKQASRLAACQAFLARRTNATSTIPSEQAVEPASCVTVSFRFSNSLETSSLKRIDRRFPATAAPKQAVEFIESRPEYLSLFGISLPSETDGDNSFESPSPELQDKILSMLESQQQKVTVTVAFPKLDLWSLRDDPRTLVEVLGGEKSAVVHVTLIA